MPTLKLLSAALVLGVLTTSASAYTISHKGPRAPKAVDRPQSCSSLARICKGMAGSDAAQCDGFKNACIASGTWSSRQLVVSGVPKK